MKPFSGRPANRLIEVVPILTGQKRFCVSYDYLTTSQLTKSIIVAVTVGRQQDAEDGLRREVLLIRITMANCRTNMNLPP